MNKSILKGYLEPVLKKAADNYFSTRAELNKENRLLIFRDSYFKSQIKLIRKELSIPKLDPDSDLNLVSVGEDEEDMVSRWVHNLTKTNYVKYDKRILSLLHVYNLPLNFHASIEFYLLYGIVPKTSPSYNPDLLDQILQFPDELKRIPLTTGEKKLIKQYVLDEYGERIKTDKKFKQAYNELMQGLALSKNKRRRMRTLTTALKATDKPKRHAKYYDDSLGKYVEPLYTFEDLAPNVIDDNMTQEEAKKKAATLRKQKQRLKQRRTSSG